MDLLGQYKEQNPEAFREKPQWEAPKEYGFFNRLIMRLSGGKIRDIDQASRTLAIVVVVIFMVSVGVLIYSFSGSGTSSNLMPQIDQHQFSTSR